MIKGDISYYLPKGKKPIAYSTIATAELLIILSEIVSRVIDVGLCCFRDKEAIEIIQKYKGYGEKKASRFFNQSLFCKSNMTSMNWPNKEYSILLANSPCLYEIEQVKEFIEFTWEDGRRRWKLKKPDSITALFGLSTGPKEIDEEVDFEQWLI